jgi:putative inorganic carbon (HCO3(-)) transporter
MGMAFWLFLLLNAVLLIRPEELFQGPDQPLRLYLIVMCLCLVAAAPRVAGQLTFQALADRPITVCIIGLLGAVVLSLLVRGLWGRALDQGGEFAKVIAYYLLLVAVVDSPGRFRELLGWLVALVAVVAAVGLLQFHGFIDIAIMRPVEQRTYDELTGQVITIPRLQSVGVYNDPNDLCLILTTGVLACLARSATAASLWARAAWLAPIALFGYAIMLTQSRGGLLGLGAGLFTLAFVRLGPKRGIPLGIVGMAALLAVFGGRQTDFSMSEEDTLQGRLQLWSEGLVMLWPNLATGIGAGEFQDRVGLVTHNSFVQVYVETGLLGGTLFAGAFFLAAAGVYRLTRHVGYWAHDPEFTGLRPFVLAMVVGYAAGAFSVSRDYVVQTYMILGLAVAYISICLPVPPDEYRSTPATWVRVALVGIGGLVFIKVMTQALVQFGGAG